MPNHTRIPTWLIGGAGIWLAYVITLSGLHMILLNHWGVPYTIKIYSLNSSESLSLAHALLVAMVSPAFFLLDTLSFFHIHVSWLDAAVYNWAKMALLSSLPVFIVGALLTTQDKRLKLAGSILGLLLIGGSLLFVLSSLFNQ